MARPIGESAQAGIGMLTGVLVVAFVMFASHLLANLFWAPQASKTR